MKLENQDTIGREKEGDRPASGESFHGQLSNRAKVILPSPRKRGALSNASIRGNWMGLFGVIGQGAIFAGGLAIGAGAMLLKRGESLKASPGLMIAVGLGCVLAAIVAKILARERSHLWTSAARG